MKREHEIEKDNYIFYYPFENNGLNYGANGLSHCFGRMMAYGSGNAEPNFSDTLSFTNFDGKYGVDVGSLAAKPVAKIEGANLNEIFNNNDFELGMEYVYRGGYTEESVLLVMCRNTSDTKGNGIVVNVGDSTYYYREWINETGVSYTNKISVTYNVWHSTMITKIGNQVKVMVVRLDNGNVILNQTLSWTNIPITYPTDTINVLGDYFPNANKSHNIRWTNGIARELYLKIL